MTSIFVAKLDFGVTSEELKGTFEQFGRVLKATVATDRETGKSRGFGFVEMADESEANNAIQALDNFKFNGRPISVKLADQKERKPQSNQRDNRDNRGPRDFKPGNNNRPQYNKPNSDERKPYNQERTDSRVESTPPPTFIDPEEITKIVTTKIDKTKKDNKDIDREKEGKKKKGGMQAYKKSGKNPRFDDFLEDEDEDYLDWKMSSRKQFEDDDEDEEDTW
jgi:RNA recognition motif-containing protein